MNEPEIVLLEDYYLKWLEFANAGIQHPSNHYLLDYAVGHLANDASILEIRSFCVRSINALAYLKRKHEATNRDMSCDNWSWDFRSGTDRVGIKMLSQAQYLRFVREAYLRSVRMFGRAVRRWGYH